MDHYSREIIDCSQLGRATYHKAPGPTDGGLRPEASPRGTGAGVEQGKFQFAEKTPWAPGSGPGLASTYSSTCDTQPASLGTLARCGVAFAAVSSGCREQPWPGHGWAMASPSRPSRWKSCSGPPGSRGAVAVRGSPAMPAVARRRRSAVICTMCHVASAP